MELDVELGGTMVDGYGQTKAGFEINGKINRKDFGLTWSMVTEAGGVVVGDDVKLHLNHPGDQSIKSTSLVINQNHFE